jgi:2-polyprenyl-6-methoxyphenol hydroxylase-like FAD-dependent oxidoreductase
MTANYDAIIIGGGIGGGVMASVLARRGGCVLVLEKATEYRDRVRGEWMAPWGIVEAKRLGLYDTLVANGAHHLARHVSYGDTIDPADAEAEPFDMTTVVPGIPGPLTLGHPAHCDILRRKAIDDGAMFLRGVIVRAMTFGAHPSVAYEDADGASHTASARIIIGADGRGSRVREGAGIVLHKDAPHHLFAGMLVDGADGWPDDLQAIGTEEDANFLAFPQGKGRVRLYLGYPREQATRLTGDKGQRAFLDAFRLKSVPLAKHLADATPAGPCASYPNEDAWTDEPFAEGVVLVGDAGGWNDPIIGQGLSITYRDVRIVSDILFASDDWSPLAFTSYAEERVERMRRLRFSAHLTSVRNGEFGDEAKARRERANANGAADPMLLLPSLASMVGPDALPAEAFDPAIKERLFA